MESLYFRLAFWLYGFSRLYICDGRVVVKANWLARLAEKLGDKFYALAKSKES